MTRGFQARVEFKVGVENEVSVSRRVSVTLGSRDVWFAAVRVERSKVM